MTWLKGFHGLNIIFLALWGLPLGSSYPLYWLLWLAYFILFDGLLFGNIWCARLLVFPPVLLACTTGPIVGYNMVAFVTRHPLYVDSPATILIVIIFAGVLTVPSLCILACYWFFRREIFMDQVERP
jgi:hypothetical protein